MFLYRRCIWLTHWGRATHICVGNLTIIGSDNGLSPDRRQAIIWTNAGILSTGPLGTNFSEILIEIYTFSFKKMHLKMPSGKWRPSCLGLNELIKIKCSSCSNGSGQCGISEIFIPCWHWWISDKQKSTKSYHVHDVASIKDVILCLIIRKFVMKCSLQLVTNITILIHGHVP